jgi:hypothetical protein
MVKIKIKRPLKRVGITEKKVLRRLYNQTYYEGTKQQRRERYRNMKQTSVLFNEFHYF